MWLCAVPGTYSCTHCRYSINVSTTQFNSKGFANKVREVLDLSGVNGSFLEFEVKESVVQEDLDEVVKTMNRLRAMGIRMALDCYGAGQSSLTCLKFLPIDKIKIDKSFVHGVEASPNDAAIVDAIISIAHQFQMEVVAGGVETREQFGFLRSRGIGMFQGHYFGEPAPAVFSQAPKKSVPVGHLEDQITRQADQSGQFLQDEGSEADLELEVEHYSSASNQL